MTTSPDMHQSGYTPISAEVPRLFNFDLPHIKQTGQPLPELADVSAIHNILDIAAESGEWAIQVAQAYPSIQVMGIESDAQLVESARAQAHGVNNVSFTAMDPFQPLDINDVTFDLVNARFIGGLLPAEAWPQLLQELWRVTRPGGYIRLTENDLPISSNPAFAKIGALISEALYATKRSFSPEGRLLSFTPALKRLLEDAGCQDVRQNVCFTNFSAGMLAHADLARDFLRTYQLVQPFLVASGVATQEEVEQTYWQMQEELRSDEFKAVAFSLTAWGQKP